MVFSFVGIVWAVPLISLYWCVFRHLSVGGLRRGDAEQSKGHLIEDQISDELLILFHMLTDQRHGAVHHLQHTSFDHDGIFKASPGSAVAEFGHLVTVLWCLKRNSQKKMNSSRKWYKIVVQISFSILNECSFLKLDLPEIHKRRVTALSLFLLYPDGIYQLMDFIP